jgi:uncharacterized repeat protein (TIGR03803 family)
LPGKIGWGANFGGSPTIVFWNSITQPTLYDFTATPFGTNRDGGAPNGGLVSLGNTLYGSAVSGGSFGNGGVFAINANGTGFTNLHSFATTPPFPGLQVNTDGANPNAGLTLLGSNIYGATPSGGSSANGTIFSLNTDGTRFRVLHVFTAGSGSFGNVTNGDGANPEAALFPSGNALYGVSSSGGGSGNGTIFTLNTDGTGFTNLHVFADGVGTFGNVTNSDGAHPVSGCFVSGNTLYGSAGGGGSWANGTVFEINTDGTDFKVLHDFTLSPSGTNSDGSYPYGVILSGNTLYGAAYGGGNSAKGTVFALNSDGSAFTILHSFSGTVDTARLRQKTA